jgi:hypothetical protein
VVATNPADADELAAPLDLLAAVTARMRRIHRAAPACRRSSLRRAVTAGKVITRGAKGEQ